MAERLSRFEGVRLSPEQEEIALLLFDKLPAETLTAAGVYLKVLKSQETDPDPWFGNEIRSRSRGQVESRNIAGERVDLLIEANDLFLRAFWFADDHTLSVDEIKEIFFISGIHQKTYTNPVAKAIHELPEFWSAPEKGYQDQVRSWYIGPNWVLDQLHIKFTEGDMRNMIFDKRTQRIELIQVKSDDRTKLRLSQEMIEKINRLRGFLT